MKKEEIVNENEKDQVLLCTHPDVTNPELWDKPKYGMLGKANFFADPGPQQEQNGVSISIDKTPSLGRRLRINVQKRTGFTDAETKRHQSAMVLLEIVVNSAEFKKRVLAKKFTTTKLTSQQVYDKIMTGEETLQKGVDYELDVIVEMYYEKSNVVGYTYGSVTWTKLNRYVTQNYDEAGIAGNCFHEWMHKLSFDHASASDHTSVPYALGYLVRDMIQEYQKGSRRVDLYPDVVVTPPVVVVPATPNSPAVETPPIKVPVPTSEPKEVCSRPFWPYFWTKKICYFTK